MVIGGATIFARKPKAPKTPTDRIDVDQMSIVSERVLEFKGIGAKGDGGRGNGLVEGEVHGSDIILETHTRVDG